MSAGRKRALLVGALLGVGVSALLGFDTKSTVGFLVGVSWVLIVDTVSRWGEE